MFLLPSERDHSRTRRFERWLPGLARKLDSSFRFIRTCFATQPATSLPMMAMTRELSSNISATKTSSTPFATPSWLPHGSETSGKIECESHRDPGSDVQIFGFMPCGHRSPKSPPPDWLSPCNFRNICTVSPQIQRREIRQSAEGTRFDVR